MINYCNTCQHYNKTTEVHEHICYYCNRRGDAIPSNYEPIFNASKIDTDMNIIDGIINYVEFERPNTEELIRYLKNLKEKY